MGIIILFIVLSIVVSPKKLFIDKGATFANLAAFMVALNIVITTIALPYGSNAVINGAMALLPALFFPLIIPDRTKRLKKIFQNNLSIKLCAIAFNVIFRICFYRCASLWRIGKSNGSLSGNDYHIHSCRNYFS